MNNKVLFQNPLLHESYEVYHHRSGLTIYVFPKKMSTTYAIFGTKYGSLNNTFRLATEQQLTTVPDGIAHFLEHKLFMAEDGSDAFERFSEYGADANAYTSFNKTAYLFSCTDRFEESLGELLDFVTHPYFPKESVEAEIGIISEEIRMYDDNPADRCFYGLLEAMYEHHSVRRNICGSVSSIRKITPELLYRCYECFYQLSNMALIVCGDVDAKTVLAIADERLPKEATTTEIIRKNENENETPQVFCAEHVEYMQVSKPIFSIGFKDTDIPHDPEQRSRKDAAMAILGEMLFSRAGELYSSLFERELISPAFAYDYTISESFAYHSLAGEADNPRAVLGEIRNYLKKLEKNGLSREDFERARRVMYAEFVKSFDSTDSIANNLFTFICEDSELLRYADILMSITFEEVSAYFPSVFREECTALSMIMPLAHKND